MKQLGSPRCSFTTFNVDQFIAENENNVKNNEEDISKPVNLYEDYLLKKQIHRDGTRIKQEIKEEEKKEGGEVKTKLNSKLS